MTARCRRSYQSPPTPAQVKQARVFAVTLEVTLPLQLMGIRITTGPPPAPLPPSHLAPSLRSLSFSFFFFLNLLVCSHVFCTPFLRCGANPTQDRPLTVMLLFSDVSECAQDLRGRSHVGHTLALEFVIFLSSIFLLLLPLQIGSFIWGGLT